MPTIQELEAEITLIRNETNVCKLNILNLTVETSRKQEQILRLKCVVQRLDTTILDLRTKLQYKRYGGD